MSNSVQLSSLANGTILAESTAMGPLFPAVAHQVNVYQRGTTTQVQVYSDAGLTTPLAQPLTTDTSGAVPGYVAGGQAIDLYDASTTLRRQANPLAAAALMTVYSVKDFGAQGIGTNDTTAFANTISAVTGSANPATTVRFPLGIMYIPPGTYKISADALLIASVQGFYMLGAGPELTFLVITGAGSIGLNIDGSAYGTFANFTIIGDGTETLTDAIALQYTGSYDRTTTQNTFNRVLIRNIITVNGVNITGHSFNDTAIFRDTYIAGGNSPGTFDPTYWQNGVLMGDGTGGSNNLDHAFYNANTLGWTTGKYWNGSWGSSLVKGEQWANGNSVCYKVAGAGSLTIEDVQAQNNQQLFTSNGSTSVSSQIALRNIEFIGNQLTHSPLPGRFINASLSGGLELKNIQATATNSSSDAARVRIGNSTSGLLHIEAVNVQAQGPTSPADIFDIADPNNNQITLRMEGCQILNGSGVATIGTAMDMGAIRTITYSASMTPDASLGPFQTIAVTNTTAMTINAPTNPPGVLHGSSGGSSRYGELTIEVLNSSGGTMGAITWNAAFVFNGFTWTNPANTKHRWARFAWNGANWICVGVSGADY